ncbi:MAG: hypothetical protein ACRDZU_15345 [Acidimicrobiales bacterium]
MTDELEQRLRAADPAPATVPVDSPRSPRARSLVEDLMTDTEISLDPPRSTRPRRWALVVAAAAAVVAVGVAVNLAGDDSSDAPSSLALSVPVEDAMAMCMQVTPESLRDASQVAFEGTVTQLDGRVATLSVDRWFAGDEVDEVVVTGADENETALLGGVVLEDGGHYLISAGDGEVRSCGLSGEASDANLAAIYDEAFGG